MKIKKITITAEDGKELIFVVDGAELDQKLSITRYMKAGGMHYTRFEHNGEMILSIKAWKGCDSFDSFVPIQDEYEEHFIRRPSTGFGDD